MTENRQPKTIQDSRRRDLTGKQFGRLRVVEFDHYEPAGGGRSLWKCLCDCGNETVVQMTSLVGGKTRSCGCLQKDIVTKHGMSNTRSYYCWAGMLQRCQNENSCEYHRYGARGIEVCDKWQTFEGFWEDMKEGYKDDLEIDRIDNSGNYTPDNCRWATKTEQANNTRKNHYLVFNGKKQTIAEWSRKTGLSYHVIHSRVSYSGWSVEEALTTPVGGKR